MKKIFLVLMPALMFTLITFGQNENIRSEQKSQAELYNDFYVGYGGLSIFYFTGNISHDYNYPVQYNKYESYGYGEENDPASPGTFYFGFSRTLNRVIGMHFIFAYQHLENTGEIYIYENNTNILTPYETKDELVTGLARITFCYLDKPFLKMYSGIGLGITLDFSKEYISGVEGTDRKIIPAGQMTLMGLRVGRAFGGFAEFGIGSLGIINAGLSYKFGD